jgi:hypothetical protein
MNGPIVNIQPFEVKKISIQIFIRLIMPLAGLPNKGLRKKLYIKNAFYQEEDPKKCTSCEMLRATDFIWILLLWH